MKRFSVILLFIAAFAVGQFAFAGANNVAIVYKVNGSVELFKSGSKTAEPLKAATHLSDGDKIKTGKDGYAFVIFVEDKSQIKVRENSTISITANRTANGLDKQVNVDVGKLWTHVTKEGSQLRVATPTSVASVKGTMWWTIVDENGNTQIIGLEGIVRLINRITNQEGDVGQGQTGESGPDGIRIIRTVGGVPNPEGTGQRSTMRIPFTDAEGNSRVLIIEYEE
ncbi:MAG: FecR family protein [bacterium]|nr:FecR family protein [bacterium]